MAELDKFKRRLIRSVARLRHKEKLPPAEMWTILNKETGRDTKAIWKRMSVLCLKKLSRLLAADDYPSGVPQLARMSLTDWIMFDLVLVHEEPDVCRLPQDSGISETTLTAFQDLLQLVKHHGLDQNSSQVSSLAETWAELTLKYNEPGREASPMLLQLRWHQMRSSARAAFYEFWQRFRGFARNLPRANERMPTQLHLAIVKMFPTIITSQLDSWKERIQNKNVVLFDQFVVTKGSENSAIKKVYEQGCFLPPDTIDGGTTAAGTNEPDIVLLEPKIDTITLEDDSDSEIAEKMTTTETDSSTCLQNNNLRDAKKSIINTEKVEAERDTLNQGLGIQIKQEPEEEMEVDGLMNVKILEASHVPTEEIDETDEQTQEPELDKETENATSILDNLLNSEKSVDSTELMQIIDERSLDNCIIPEEENNECRKEDRNLDEDINDITETIEDCSEVVDKTTTTEALQSHDMLTENNLDDCVISREENKSNEECDEENNHDEDRNNIIPETIEDCSEVKEQNSTTEELQTNDWHTPEEKEKNEEVEKEIHLDEDRNDIIKKTVEDCSDTKDKTTTTKALQSHDMASEGLEKPTEDQNISSKNDVEFNSLVELPSSIELLDDGIDICEEEDDDLFYQDNTVKNAYEIKSEPTEDAEDSEEEFKIDEDSEPAKLDLKLIMFPVVYTTKLEDMTLFQEADYETVKTDVLIEAITAESKPVSKKSINIKPAEIMTKETKVIALINEEKRDSEDLIKLVPDDRDDDVHDDVVPGDDFHDDDFHDNVVHDDGESDIDEIPDAQRVNITSTLFKKPTFRNYNSISVCKNPDFNTRLKRLSVGFFTYERNIQLYNACKPLTVDLHKSFETKLDNGVIYLNKDKSNSPTTVSEPINNQPVSVTPSALPAQCLIDNRKSDIQELIPAKNLTIDEDLINEQQKVINLPHIEKPGRVNKQLLTVEVSPLLAQNHDITTDINIVESDNGNSKSIDSDQALETIITEDAKIDMTSTVEAVLKPIDEIVENAKKPLLSLEISPLYLNIPPTTVSGDKPNSVNTIVSNVPAKTKKPKKTNVSTNFNSTVPWYLRKQLNRDMPVIINKSKEDEALITVDSLYSMIEVMEGNWSEGKKISNEKKQFTKKFNEQSSTEVDKTTENVPNPITKNPGKPKKRPRKKKEYCCWALEKYCCDMIMSNKQSQRKQKSNLKKIHDCGSVCSCCCRHILAKSFEERATSLDSDPEKSQYSPDAIEKAVDLIKNTNEEIDLPTDNTTPAVSVITNCKVANTKDAETTPLHNISDIDNCFGNLVNLIESKTKIAATSTVSESEKPLPKLNSSGSNELIILSDDEDNEKIVTANHLEPKWITTPVSENNKHQLASPFTLSSTSTSPAKKAAGSKYVINYKKSLTPECPIKLGKNQILLTSVKIPSHLGKQMPYLPEPVVTAPILDQSRLMIPEIPLPKGVSLVLHPDGQLNASLENGLVLQCDDLKKVENVVSAVQRQIYLHFGVGTESDASKCDVDLTKTNVIDLVNDATKGITNTDVTNADTNIETCEEVTNTITHVPSADVSMAIANESCESSNLVPNPIFEANHDSNNDASLSAKQQNSLLCQNDQNEVGHTNIAPENHEKDLAQLYKDNRESHDINKNEDEDKIQDHVSHLNDVSPVNNAPEGSDVVSETSRGGKKSILSDLMEMSGISSEDVQPSTTEVQLPYLYPAVDCAIDAIDQQPSNVLTQVTTVECLKYAYKQNGKFFKMDIKSGHIKRIDVSIEKRKQNIRQIKRIYVPQPPPAGAPNARTLVIDLTNQDHSQATKPMISLKPLKNDSSKSKVSNEVKTGLLSEISQLKTNQISLLRKHIHLRNFMQLSKSNRDEIKNKIQNKINLVDSDEPMFEEYLIETDEDDDISEITSHNKNKRTHQDVSSDDSDDEPLAKKVQRKKDEARNIEREICDVNVPVDNIEQDEEYEIEQLDDGNDMFSDASHDSGECILGA